MSTHAKLFALATDEEQAEWLNVAGRMWKTFDSGVYADLQASRIVDRLNDDGKRLILRFASMIEAGKKP